MVRALLLVTFALGLAGFCLAAVGWGKANAAVLNVQSAYTQVLLLVGCSTLPPSPRPSTAHYTHIHVIIIFPRGFFSEFF